MTIILCCDEDHGGEFKKGEYFVMSSLSENVDKFEKGYNYRKYEEELSVKHKGSALKFNGNLPE